MGKQHRNCPNCGAPYEIERCRCPYCGTAYFDMSIIDFDNKEPFFLKIKSNGYLITQLVFPETGNISTEMNEVRVTTGHSNAVLYSFEESRSATTDISLKALAFKSALSGGDEVLMLAEKAE